MPVATVAIDDTSTGLVEDSIAVHMADVRATVKAFSIDWADLDGIGGSIGLFEGGADNSGAFEGG